MAVAEELQVEVRESRGKQAAKQVRREGRIPGVVYSAKEESVPVSVSAYDFAAVRRNHGLSAIVKLQGLPSGDCVAVYKQLQLHPVRYDTQHIDFQAIPPGDKITMRVMVRTTGLPIGVDQEGGAIVKAHDVVEVRGLPADIPEMLEVDITHLHRGDALHARELPLPDGIELVTEGRITMASVTGTRAALAQTKADELGEGEEGEGAEGAEGEAAEGDAKPAE